MTDATEHAGHDTEWAGREPARTSGRHARRVGDYELLSLLGQGAMGAVYLARHVERSEQRLALKVMSSHLLEEPEALRRFELELQSLVQLRHPAIVAVHDAGQLGDGRPWYAMDWVEGENLRDALKRGIPLDEGLSVLAQMAEALAHLHSHGLVHRDFKPDNVLVDPQGVARLTDFGLARGEDRAERLTRSDEILGTPRYMAPEQVSRTLGEVGPWTDVFAFGAVLYELLTGRTPYQGATSMECFTQLTEGEPFPTPGSLVPSVDRGLEAVCLRALERDPGKRFADGEELVEALRAIAIEPRGDGPPPGGGRLVRSLSLVALVSLLLGAGAVVSALLGSARDAELAARIEAQWGEDVLAARRELRDGVVVPDRHWILLFSGDAPGAARALRPEVPARDQAWIAALAGDSVRCEQALERIPGELGRLTRWELAPIVSGLALPASGASAEGLGEGWDAVAAGEEHLARGRVALALLAFDRVVRRDGAEPGMRALARFGRARALLARGEVAAVLSDLAECRATLPDAGLGPLPLARAEACEALVRGAVGEAPDEALARVRRRCPGLPEAAEAIWVASRSPGDATPPGASRVTEARAAARTDAARARVLLGRPGGDCFLEDELLVCVRGEDGPPGLLLARGFALARMAEKSGHSEAAARARELLGLAVRLRPHSPAAWVGLARAHLVVHDLSPASTALAKARELLPDDAQVCLLAAQVQLAALEKERVAADVSRSAARERALIEPLRGVRAACQAAIGAADPGSSLELEARLRAGEVSCELVERLGEAGDGEAASQERAQLSALLAPVRPSFDVAAVASAREALARALLQGDPLAVQSPARELARRVGDPSLAELRALRLLAATGGPEAEASRQALRAAATDLPAQALLALHRARVPAADASWSELASGLGQRLPAVVLHQERGQDARSLCALAGAIERDPAWVSPCLELLAGGPVAELPGPGTPVEHLARALSCLARSRGAGEEEAARLRREAWLAATTRLQADLEPSAAAHLLRALSVAEPLGPSQADLEDDLLAVRAGAPWEWTAALRRLDLVARDAPQHLGRLDEVLELGCRVAEIVPTNVHQALTRFKPHSLESCRASSEAAREAGLPRLAMVLILPWLKTPAQFDRSRLVPLEEALPADRRRAIEPLVTVRRGRLDLDAGRESARRALGRSAPAGRHPTLALDHLAGGSSGLLLARDSAPGRPTVWAVARSATRPETFLHCLALLEGYRDGGFWRGASVVDPELLGRALALGPQESQLLEAELGRALDDGRTSDAALAWAAAVAFSSVPPQERVLALATDHLRARRDRERTAEAQLEAIRTARSLASSLVGLAAPERDLARLARVDLTVDLGGRLSWEQRREMLEEARAEADEIHPSAVAAVEPPGATWWRLIRARVAVRDADGARAAWEQLQGASESPAGDLRGLWRGRPDPWTAEIQKLDPGLGSLIQQAEELANDPWGLRGLMRGFFGDRDGDRGRGGRGRGDGERRRNR